jgi:5-methyltetrahydropteroyltriglutamate--homocysteine methyltransferase
VTIRADHVGSLLRPPRLLEARRGHDAGSVKADELRALEDEAIADAVRREVESGIGVITDGEFRRRDFRTGFVQAVDGIEMRTFDMPWHTSAGVTKLASKQFVITGRLVQLGRLAGAEAAYLLDLRRRGLTSGPVKVTLIAPGFLADRFWKDGETDKYYESREELAAQVAAITRAEIQALIAEGVSYVQLDNPGYSSFLGSFGSRGAFERMLSTDIAAITDLARPTGVSIGMHVCRGNQASMWLGEGDYQPIAEQLFSTLPVDRFLLEYDDDRAGGFEPLRYLPPDKTVVLGLVSSKKAILESPDTLARRIDEAASLTVAGLDKLALSPQCGFASVAEGGNLLSVDEQFAKLRLVAETASTVWA